jgi:hypothetical protein
MSDDIDAEREVDTAGGALDGWPARTSTWYLGVRSLGCSVKSTEPSTYRLNCFLTAIDMELHASVMAWPCRQRKACWVIGASAIHIATFACRIHLCFAIIQASVSLMKCHLRSSSLRSHTHPLARGGLLL